MYLATGFVLTFRFAIFAVVLAAKYKADKEKRLQAEKAAQEEENSERRVRCLLARKDVGGA